MSINGPVQNNSYNYMVPSGGTTHCVYWAGQFPAIAGAGYLIDFAQFANDAYPFQPQAVYIDNSLGTVALEITVLNNGFTLSCAAGSRRAINFPSPANLRINVWGDPANNASIYFVDYPVFADSSNLNVPAGGLPVNVPPTATGGVPYSVDVPATADGGAPYQFVERPASFQYVQNSGAGATVTVIPPAGNLYLRRVIFNLKGSSALAAAAENELTLTVNGTVVYQRSIYIPSAALDNQGLNWEVDFYQLAPAVGAGPGNVVATWTTALSAGGLEVACYFTT